VLREFGVKTAALAYDADALTNANVARHLRNSAKALVKVDFADELERWALTDGKGIDDLLAGGKKPEALTGEEAMQAIDEIARVAAQSQTPASSATPVISRTMLRSGYQLSAFSPQQRAL